MNIYIDFKSLKKKKSKEPKNQFPTGTRAYKGHQGMGKTLSMCEYIFRLKQKFPECIIYSNVMLNGIEDYHYTKTDKEVYEGLAATNGEKGVINVIDECHLFCNKKTGISLDFLTQISQQRKERRKIIISSQIWEDLDISLRKQVPEIVSCKHFGNLQINLISDGQQLHYNKTKSQYEAPLAKIEIFKRNDEYFNRYNTYQKIETNAYYKREYTPNPTIIQNISSQGTIKNK